MDLLITLAVWALGAITLIAVLSLLAALAAGYFIFKSRKDSFDDFERRRLHNQGALPKSHRKPPMPPLKKPKK